MFLFVLKDLSIEGRVFPTMDGITDELKRIRQNVGTLNIKQTKYSSIVKPKIFIFRCLS